MTDITSGTGILGTIFGVYLAYKEVFVRIREKQNGKGNGKQFTKTEHDAECDRRLMGLRREVGGKLEWLHKDIRALMNKSGVSPVEPDDASLLPNTTKG